MNPYYDTNVLYDAGEVAVAAAPVTETPQVPVTAETENNAKGTSEEADVTSEK